MVQLGGYKLDQKLRRNVGEGRIMRGLDPRICPPESLARDGRSSPAMTT